MPRRRHRTPRQRAHARWKPAPAWGFDDNLRLLLDAMGRDPLAASMRKFGEDIKRCSDQFKRAAAAIRERQLQHPSFTPTPGFMLAAGAKEMRDMEHATALALTRPTGGPT